MDEQFKNRLIAQNMRRLRKKAGFTQTQVAERLNTSQGLIARLENGKGITLDRVRELAGVYGVSENAILDTTPDELPEDPRAAILADYTSPAGLRELAADEEVKNLLQITKKEWVALRGLAQSWSDSQITNRDGWVQVLFTLRAVSSSSVTKS